jgi:Cysteine sulfinate desulfinase/cysteine desulfurase and related enzymes
MIYLDNAATTKMDALCIASFERFGIEEFYNPSALYAPSVGVTRALDEARSGLLSLLHGNGDLIFTASGTEADNMALFGAKKPKNSKIIVSAGEHAAVFNPAEELRARGYNVVYAPLNADGSLCVAEFSRLLSGDVSLVSVMHVNNETGAVNDIGALVKMVRRAAPKALFHSDGVQALGKVPINLRAMDVDFYSVSAHKIHAPKGVGALYIKNGVNLNPLIFGGGQEKGLRSATENVAGIDAFYRVAKRDLLTLFENATKKIALLKVLRTEIEKRLPSAQILSPENSPHILMLAMQGVRGETVMHALENYGILIGIGSACSSKKGVNRFRTLLSLDKSHEEGVIRISVGAENTLDEIKFFVNKLVEIVDRLSAYKRI